jgi:hypothetical protein
VVPPSRKGHIKKRRVSVLPRSPKAYETSRVLMPTRVSSNTPDISCTSVERQAATWPSSAQTEPSPACKTACLHTPTGNPLSVRSWACHFAPVRHMSLRSSDREFPSPSDPFPMSLRSGKTEHAPQGILRAGKCRFPLTQIYHCPGRKTISQLFLYNEIASNTRITWYSSLLFRNTDHVERPNHQGFQPCVIFLVGLPLNRGLAGRFSPTWALPGDAELHSNHRKPGLRRLETNTSYICPNFRLEITCQTPPTIIPNNQIPPKTSKMVPQRPRIVGNGKSVMESLR